MPRFKRCIIWKFISTGILFLTGCATISNMDMHDVRTSQKIVRQGVLQMSLDNIQHCSERYQYHCGATAGSIKQNPDNAKEARLIVYGPGLTQVNPYIIIDFIEQNTNQTSYIGYSALSTWNSYIGRAISDILDCGRCAKK